MSDLPESVGKYRVLGRAGQGAMGVVYLGHDPVIDREVAIKVYRVGDTDDPEARLTRKVFYNEARAAGALDHPGILKIFDAGEVEGEPYIAMEYVPGGDTLRHYCTPESLLPPATAVAYVVQAARALDYAHQRGVTHRDIKPANLLLTPDGQVKIGDFGIAVRAHASATQVLGSFGSPRYVSPEQARGEPVTPRSDLYSLGVVLYELLAGCPPFTGGNLSTLLYKVLYEEAPRLEKLRPGLPGPLVEAVHRAIDKEAEQRFGSGQEMAETLEAVLAEGEAPTVPATPEAQAELLAGLRFFRDFSPRDLGEVLRAGTWRTYRPGTRIVEEGSEEDAFYVLVAGHVLVSKGGQEIDRIAPGECFGEMGYLGGGARSATVFARTAVACLRVSGALTQWASLPCQLRLSRAFQRTLIERLAQTSDQLSRRLSG